MTPEPPRGRRSRHADDQAVTVTTIHSPETQKSRSLVVIDGDAIILIQRGGQHYLNASPDEVSRRPERTADGS